MWREMLPVLYVAPTRGAPVIFRVPQNTMHGLRKTDMDSIPGITEIMISNPVEHKPV